MNEKKKRNLSNEGTSYKKENILIAFYKNVFLYLHFYWYKHLNMKRKTVLPKSSVSQPEI